MQRSKTIMMLLLTLTALSAAQAARADCYYNGQHYGENERIGGFVCQNGQWVSG